MSESEAGKLAREFAADAVDMDEQCAVGRIGILARAYLALEGERNRLRRTVKNAFDEGYANGVVYGVDHGNNRELWLSSVAFATLAGECEAAESGDA